MIFKNLFRPKHQHSDAKVRQQAVASLDPGNPEHKTALHEMAFNDESIAVRLAALDKLNSFALWWKLAQTERQERVHKRAQQRVESILLDDQADSLTDKQRHTFVQECANYALLEKLLLQRWQHDQPALSQAVLAKIDKSTLRQRVMFETNDASLRLALAEQEQEPECLQRMLRKHKDPQIVELARQKLDKLSQEQLDKQQLERELRLVLAKLLALKDCQEYPLLCEQLKQLSAQFESQQEKLTVLPQAIREEILSKFQDLTEKVRARAEAAKHGWQLAESERKATELASQIKQQAQLWLNDVTNQQNIEQLSEQARCTLLEQIEMHRKALQGLPADQAIESLHNRFAQIQIALDKLPALQQAIEGARTLLDSIQGVALPDSLAEFGGAQQAWQEARGAYRELKKPHGDLWPLALHKQWQVLDKAWQNAISELRQQAKAQVNKVRGGLHKVQDMIDAGKFNAALSLYQRLQENIQALPEQEMQALQRLSEQVQAQIENLKEWQVYIAQPRKPALLNEIRSLLDAPLPIKEQAEKVKQLRSQWNSLGKLESDEDSELNQAFDQACELAFIPVREYYAQAEQVREQNLQAKLAVLSQLTELAQADISMEELARQQQGLEKQWRDIGEIDYRRVAELNQEFRDRCAPVKAKLLEWYQDNEAQKQRLVEKVQSLLDAEDTLEAIGLAKQAQESWKKIGRGRAKVDRQLWSAFRAANDALFARRNEAQQQQRQANNAVIGQIDALLDQAALALREASEQTQLQALQSATQQQLTDLVSELDARATQSKMRDWQKLENQIADKAKALRKDAKQAQFALLLDILSQWQEEQLPARVEQLPGVWRQAFAQTAERESRARILLKMELLAGVESPQEEAEMRRETQLEMMTNKLEQGESLDLQKLLIKWIGQGPIAASEQEQVVRLQRLFVPHD